MSGEGGSGTALLAIGPAGSPPAPEPEASARERTRGARSARRAWFVARRLGRLMALLLALWLIAFFMVRLIPGDPAERALGLQATPEAVASLRASLGLDEPLGAQIVDSFTRLAKLDLGTSFTSGEPVTEVIAGRMPKTAELAGLAFAIVMVLGVVIGTVVAAATQQGRRPRLDLAFGSTTSLVGATPEFMAATLLAFVVGLKLGWLPVATSDGAASVILPALAVSAAPTALLARIVRAETVRVLDEDYVRTARSKRLPWWRLYGMHVLPNAMTGALTIGGLVFASLVGGTVVVENVFAWPGLGIALTDAVIASDYPLIQGSLLVLGATVIAVNTVVDLLLGVFDPLSQVRR